MGGDVLVPTKEVRWYETGIVESREKLRGMTSGGPRNTGRREERRGLSKGMPDVKQIQVENTGNFLGINNACS